MGLRHLFRGVALAIVGLAVAGCLAPQYTYVTDSSDSAYFKVPPSWQQVNESSVESTEPQSTPLGNSRWMRVYDASATPSVAHVFSPTAEPIAYAGVVSLSSAERGLLSYNGMRDWLLPVTSQARSAAAASHLPFVGFASITDQVLSNGHGYRGIREIFDYTIGLTPETFDLTVLTDSATTKLYFLLVQCTSTCFVDNYHQISAVVGSFTVGGS